MLGLSRSLPHACTAARFLLTFQQKNKRKNNLKAFHAPSIHPSTHPPTPSGCSLCLSTQVTLVFSHQITSVCKVSTNLHHLLSPPQVSTPSYTYAQNSTTHYKLPVCTNPLLQKANNGLIKRCQMCCASITLLCKVRFADKVLRKVDGKCHSRHEVLPMSSAYEHANIFQ